MHDDRSDMTAASMNSSPTRFAACYLHTSWSVWASASKIERRPTVET